MIEWDPSNHHSRSHSLNSPKNPARRNAMVETRLTGEKLIAETVSLPLYHEETEHANEREV